MLPIEHLFSKPVNKDYKDWFEQIARELFTNYVLSTGSAKYRFKEVEFYYHSKDHPDTSTYGYYETDSTKLKDRILRHKLAQRKTATWFIHYSGIDIVFGSEGKPGGILIRAIERLESDGHPAERINGPLVVMLELFNQEMNLDGSQPIKLALQEADKPNSDIALETKVRTGINGGGFHDKEYKFYVK